MMISASLLLGLSISFVGPGPEESLALASGEKVRIERNVAWQEVQVGDLSWRAIMDSDLRVPLRMYGRGLPADGAIESDNAAKRFADLFLVEHITQLAPGSTPADFVLVSNVVDHNGIRTVAYQQTRMGLRVEGGQVSFRFKHDRLIAVGSEAFPHLTVERNGNTVSKERAIGAALNWVRGSLRSVEGPFVRALVLQEGGIAQARVLRVVVDTTAPIGRWAVDIDASNGKPFAKEQLLKFADGRVLYHVPVRNPQHERYDAVAPFTYLQLDAQQVTTSANGGFSWTSTMSPSVQTSVVGSLVRVANDAGAVATKTFNFSDGMDGIWDDSNNERIDAQLITFIAAHQSRNYVKAIAPGLRFLDRQLLATVNIADVCNAFSDGETINFFLSGQGCENTGRISDVVHHEYGHSIHANAIIQGAGSFDSSLSEGASDYLAATIANDPAMGGGFFFSDEPLRHLDPFGEERRWPEDRSESHETGLIIGGALWDLRKEMIAQHGMEEGVRLTDQFWFDILQRASNIPSSYVEVLVSDDDDGDLGNGSPNYCTISEQFARHGLVDPYQSGQTIGRVTIDGLRVSLPVGETAICPGTGIVSSTLKWQVRGNPDLNGTIPMTLENAIYIGDLPLLPEGSVLEYSVETERENGQKIVQADNPADPSYQVFIGEVTPIYCTDFESDPLLEGWASALVAGSGRRIVDEWEWGEPASGQFGSGDPATAYSGTDVIGDDLGLSSDFANGTYQRNKTSELVSPTIDVSGHPNVRLQYRRWLTVEDGDGDQAEIIVGGQTVWKNFASGTGMGDTHHIDKEWRFHDVDLTEVAAANGNRISVTFRLTADQGLSFGGWTIDDFCLVGWDGPTAVCGDSKIDFGEACDDGNSIDGDGCDAGCVVTPMTMEPMEPMMPMNPEIPDPMLKQIDDESGCSCTASAEQQRGQGLALFGLLIAGLALSRARRR